MIWLNWPPEEWPYSGENWFAITVNSETASLGTCTNGPVMDLLLLSTPSMVKLLSRGRWPPPEGPVPPPTAPPVAIPAWSSDAFMTPDPPDTIGRLASCSEVYVFCSCAVVVSITAPSAETSTVWVDVPTSSVTFAVATWFRVTSTPFSSDLVNPAATTTMSYLSTRRLLMRYCPAKVVVVVDARLVLSPVAVIVALGTTAPVESNTVPVGS